MSLKCHVCLVTSTRTTAAKCRLNYVFNIASKPDEHSGNSLFTDNIKLFKYMFCVTLDHKMLI